MSFQTTAIKYGWMYLTALGVITGTTIYVANNTRKQVLPVDIIQIPLAVTERALALQYGTNALGEPLYYVDPPSFVRTWTSNVYTTNGVTVYTNIVTNTIGWHTDRTMMVSLDATIKALVPYYVDTNTVYDGTTNIAMLTVTGLWASLGIGDGTNKFTRTPAWTNPVSTNWVVSYTNFQVHGYPYWVLTNTYFSSIITNDDDVIIKDVQQEYWYWFGTTNLHICYTSSLDEAVYAVTNIIKESYFVASVSNIGVITNFFAERVGTLPGYYISNFPQVVSQTTNAATYGDYPWQIYVEDLQERYKVLEALKMTKRDLGWTVATTNERYLFVNNGDGRTNYDVMVAYYSSHWPSDHVAGYHVCAKMTDLNYSDYPRIIGLEGWCAYAYVNSIYVDTNLSKSVSYFVRSKGWQNWMSGPFVFNAQGVTMGTNWTLLTTANIGFNSSNPVPVIVGDENSGCPTVIPFSDTYDENDFFYGWELQDITVTCDWQFNYATNKYW